MPRGARTTPRPPGPLTFENHISSKHKKAMNMLGTRTFRGSRVAGAGLALGLEPAQRADLTDWDRMIDVNLKSIFLSMKHEINAMLAAGNGGAIVNIASTNSYRPQPHQCTRHHRLGQPDALGFQIAYAGNQDDTIQDGYAPQRNEPDRGWYGKIFACQE